MDPISATQAELIGTKDRMVALLRATPEDKLNWKPTPQSRSIVEIVAHSAHALSNIHKQLSGTPFAVPTSLEANQIFLEHDSAWKSGLEVEAYLEEACRGYVDFLSTLQPKDLDRMVTLPFGLGEAPMGYFMTMGHVHTLGHIAQIEYVQTMYGDLDWHTGF